MKNEAIENLKETLGGKITDPFSDGDVIRWTGGGRYIYAAIKTPIGWVTTALSSGNQFVERVYDYEGLTGMLAKINATDISVATTWELIR